ncbi:uncharacterized protein B0I36DRAFT_216122, partial [Microdochium trichocladiopsis]
MGWARHLAGSDMGVHFRTSLSALSAVARAKLRGETEITEQDRLLRLGASFERLIAKALERTAQVPNEVLRYLASSDASRPAAGPFKTEKEQNTKDRYLVYWKRYLCYCIRAGRLSREEATEKLRIRFNDAQWATLTDIIQRLDNTSTRNKDDNISVVSSTYSDSEEPETLGYELDGGDNHVEDPIDQAVMAFCVESLQQRIAVQLFSNPLLYFTAVLGISGTRKSHAWRPANEYTTQIAGLVWCARLIMLEHSFAGYKDGEDGEDGEDIGQEAIEHFRVQHRDWLADGSFSPFSAMTRMMTYGKGFRKKEGGTPRLMWEDSKEALRYLGQR